MMDGASLLLFLCVETVDARSNQRNAAREKITGFNEVRGTKNRKCDRNVSFFASPCFGSRRLVPTTMMMAFAMPTNIIPILVSSIVFRPSSTTQQPFPPHHENYFVALHVISRHSLVFLGFAGAFGDDQTQSHSTQSTKARLDPIHQSTTTTTTATAAKAE